MADSVSSTSEKPVSRTLDEIIKEAHRIEESACLTSKGHFVASHNWTRLHYLLGVPMFIIASVLGAAAFSSFDKGNHYAGILSLVVAVLSALMTFLNPYEKATNHLNAGNSYASLENQVRIFRTIECWKTDAEAVLSQKIIGFSDHRDQLNATSPQVPWMAYFMARIGIGMGEASYKIDKPTKK